MRFFSTLLSLSVILSFSVIVLSSGCASNIHRSIAAYTLPLPDGFYRVMRTGNHDKDILPLAENERIIPFNQFFFEKTDQENKFVVVLTDDFVPLSLQSKPTESELDDQRKTKTLLLSLTEDAKNRLTEFTTAHLNKMTGIVVGGEALTMHKIKTVIDSGKLQISRCSDNACELLYVELQDNVTQ